MYVNERKDFDSRVAQGMKDVNGYRPSVGRMDAFSELVHAELQKYADERQVSAPINEDQVDSNQGEATPKVGDGNLAQWQIESRQRGRDYFINTVKPAIQSYLDVFNEVGAESLEKNRIKPDGMTPRQWLDSFVNRQSTWDKGRKTNQTGIQYLSIKDLWPYESGVGERLRKSMLAAVKALKNSPMMTSDWLADAYGESIANSDESLQVEAAQQIETPKEFDADEGPHEWSVIKAHSEWRNKLAQNEQRFFFDGMNYGTIIDTHRAEDRSGKDKWRTSDGMLHEKLAAAKAHEIETLTKPRLIENGYLIDDRPVEVAPKEQSFEDMLDSVLDQELGVEQAPVSENPVSPKIEEVDSAPAEYNPKRTAAAAGASAIKNTGSSLANAAKGLNALFAVKPGTLGSGPVFDEDTYEQAKPYFKMAVADLKLAAMDMRDMIVALVRGLVANGLDRTAIKGMSPYLERFVQDTLTNPADASKIKETSETPDSVIGKWVLRRPDSGRLIRDMITRKPIFYASKEDAQKAADGIARTDKPKTLRMSLTNVAAPIWNEIARTQKLKTAWAKKVFSLDDQAITELENKEYQSLKEKVGATVASAYLNVKPLLLENQAISRYIQAKQDQSLRIAMPEIVTLSEAAMLASMDSPLSQTQQQSLMSLLKADLI